MSRVPVGIFSPRSGHLFGRQSVQSEQHVSWGVLFNVRTPTRNRWTWALIRLARFADSQDRLRARSHLSSLGALRNGSSCGGAGTMKTKNAAVEHSQRRTAWSKRSRQPRFRHRRSL